MTCIKNTGKEIVVCNYVDYTYLLCSHAKRFVIKVHFCDNIHVHELESHLIREKY